MSPLARSIALGLLLAASAAQAAPWTYRGTLNDGGVPANGRYDLRLSLLDASGAKSLAYPLTFNGVEVKNGAFAVDVDFGLDLTLFGALKLKTEVGQGSSGFVALGEPKVFDPKATLAGVCWETQGNAGTNAATDFLGTTDDAPLRMRVNNMTVGTFEEKPNGINVLLGSPDNSAAIDADGAIVLGDGNSVIGNFGVVSGGLGNVADASGAVVGGVYNHAAYRSFSVGAYNCAGGSSSFAAGFRAKIRPGNGDSGLAFGCNAIPAAPDAQGDSGSFVWADLQNEDFISSGDNQFLVRAQGGVGINAAPPDGGIELTVTSDADGLDYPNIWLKQRGSANDGILMSAGDGNGTNNAGFHIDHFNGSLQRRRFSLHNNGEVVIRSSIVQANTGVILAPGAGAWSAISDRSAKTAIEAINARVVLDRLVEMPVSEWSYIAQGESIRHIGPMAQDFAAAFGVGENDTTISTVDADGVALAAIQGLNAKLESENAQLKSQLTTLAERLQRLEAAVVGKGH